MADKEKSPYEILLDEFDNLKKEHETIKADYKAIKTELEEVKGFNRALLSRNTKSSNTEDKDEIKVKFDKYLKGE